MAAGEREEPVVDAAGRRVVDVDVEEGDGKERESTESDFQRSRQARESAEVRTASRRSRRTRISSCRTTGREESRSSSAAACFGSIMPPVPDSPPLRLSARQRLLAEAAASDGSLLQSVAPIMPPLASSSQNLCSASSSLIQSL